MDSGRRKKAKIRAEEEEEEREKEEQVEVDRLSNLPEQLIHHILSFMDTKFAVQTCVLSSRWKSLWTSLPILILNSDTFRKLKSFDKFVSHVLSGIRSRSAAAAAAADSSSSGDCVSGFDFTRGGTLSPALLKKVVKFVESQRVQNLSISISYCKQPGFLSNIVRLKSLKHLKLTNDSYFEGLDLEDSFLNLPALTTLHLERVLFSKLDLEYSFFNLPALTTLHLEEVSFSKFHSTRFFSDCLNLKKLTLVECSTLGLEVFNISLPQLESLTILRGYNHCYSWKLKEDNCKFVVSASKLTSLTLKGFPALQLNAQSLPSLEQVELDICFSYENTSELNQLVASQFINFLAELSRAKSLTLSPASIKVLSAYPDLLKHQPSPCSNLKFLKLNLNRYITSVVPDHVMTYLVGCSPGVEVVTESSKRWYRKF